MNSIEICSYLEKEVIKPNNCTGCGMCVALLGGVMVYKNGTVLPDFVSKKKYIEDKVSNMVYLACPGHGISYPSLYRKHYGRLPDNWLFGNVKKIRTGYALDSTIRRNSASGGVMTSVLCYLLESKRVDAVIIVRQGLKTPEEALVTIAHSLEEVLLSAQSVYIPVSVLDILSEINPKLRYAITCLPEQAASLRVLQHLWYEPANQIKYVLGPYTGTALESSAIRCLLKSRGIYRNDRIVSLKWRAGEWPGYLEIKLSSGKVVKSKKVYYNFLIPFFITQASLQSIDFTNEFSDLSVGDAWSPKFENIGAGFSVIVTRSTEMESIINEMIDKRFLKVENVALSKAGEMHGHMIDFKKRGGFIRNKWKSALGFKVPNYGIYPSKIPFSRYVVECVISGLFIVCRNRFSRKILEFIPEAIIGPLFNKLRLFWKFTSRPTKRNGLENLDFIESDNGRLF